MNYYLLHFIIALAMVAAAALVLGTFAYLRHSTKLGVIYAWYCYAIAVWSFFQIFMIVPGDVNRAYFYGRLSQIGVVFIPTLFIHFIHEFCQLRNTIHKIILQFGYLVSFAVLISIPTRFFISGVIPKFGGLINFVTPGPFDYIFVVYFVFAASYGVYKLGLEYFRAGQSQKHLTGLFFLGSLLAYSGGGSNFFLTFGFNPYPLTPFGTYGVAMYFSLVAYGLFRYQFVDIYSALQLAHQERLAALGTLASSITHEIRNPLYVIKGLAETRLENLKSTSPDARIKDKQTEEMLEKTLIQIDRVNQITRRLSEFTRADQSPRYDEEVNIMQTIDDALFYISQEVQVSNIQIVKAIAPVLSTVRGNKREIEEIFLNLIANAVQAMRSGGVLTITAKCENSPVLVSFKDTGSGIKKSQLKHIFEPFFSTKGNSGLGLGLYITKQLVERNGGKIEVSSKEGKGTTFIVNLPKWTG